MFIYERLLNCIHSMSAVLSSQSFLICTFSLNAITVHISIVLMLSCELELLKVPTIIVYFSNWLCKCVSIVSFPLCLKLVIDSLLILVFCCVTLASHRCELGILHASPDLPDRTAAFHSSFRSGRPCEKFSVSDR